MMSVAESEKTVVVIEDRRGNRCEIEYPAPRPTRNYFPAGLHKAGSSLLHSLIEAICAAAGAPTVQIASALFSRGLRPDDFSENEIKKLDLPGYVYTSFRTAHFLESLPSYRYSPKLLLVRDPRDAAVSFYFSLAYSHTSPGEGPARHDFNKRRELMRTLSVSSAITTGKLDHLFRNQSRMCVHKRLLDDILVFRYEDVIFEKRRWASDLARWLEVDVNTEVLTAIADRMDVIPSEENRGAHIRQVKPGNHKDHLTEEAVAYIEKLCPEFFDTFGYERVT